MATIDLEELRKEIEADRQSLADKEAVLRFLEARASESTSPLKPRADAIIQLEELLPETKRRTLINDVEDVVSRFGDQEFSVVHVEAALKRLGVEFKGDKSPRPRISSILGKLEEQRIIVKAFEGKGNVPHRYLFRGYPHDLV